MKKCRRLLSWRRGAYANIIEGPYITPTKDEQQREIIRKYHIPSINSRSSSVAFKQRRCDRLLNNDLSHRLSPFAANYGRWIFYDFFSFSFTDYRSSSILCFWVNFTFNPRMVAGSLNNSKNHSNVTTLNSPNSQRLFQYLWLCFSHKLKILTFYYLINETSQVQWNSAGRWWLNRIIWSWEEGGKVYRKSVEFVTYLLYFIRCSGWIKYPAHVGVHHKCWQQSSTIIIRRTVQTSRSFQIFIVAIFAVEKNMTSFSDSWPIISMFD